MNDKKTTMNNKTDTIKPIKSKNRGPAFYICAIVLMVLSIAVLCVGIQWIFLGALSLLFGILSFVFAFLATDRFNYKTTFIKVIDVFSIFISSIFCLVFIIGISVGG